MTANGTTRDAGPKDVAITILAVLISFFLVGWVTPVLPLGGASGWVSAAAFALLVFLYAWLTEPGRRSGFPHFLVAGLLIWPAIVIWIILLFTLSEGSPLLQLQHLEVGFTDQAIAHAALPAALIWSVAMTFLVAVAVTVRELIEGLRS